MAHFKKQVPLLLVLLIVVAEAAIIAAQGNGNNRNGNNGSNGNKGNGNNGNGNNRNGNNGNGNNGNGNNGNGNGQGNGNGNNGNNGNGNGNNGNENGNGNNRNGNGNTPSGSIPSPPPPPPPTVNYPPPSTNAPSPHPPHNYPPTTPSPPPPSTPTPTPTPPPPSTGTSPTTAKCKNKNYKQCYDVEYTCPSSCPGGCEVDCTICKPVCKCDRPGAVCQDPRFIGGDGITFYFHGKKDRDFCLVTDSNLHINGHFIGRRNDNMKRDFTWVQSIAVLFDKHQLFIGALKTSKWVDSNDRLVISFDGAPVTLHESEGAKWQSAGISIIRLSDTNSVIVEAQGNFKITAKVVPITEQDSRIHNYGITAEDCFAHLDLGFKFHSLSDEVNGVLGQTYRPDYVSRMNVRVSMPVMGGNREFKTSSLFAPDCAVAHFSANGESETTKIAELPNMRCASGIDGRGVICKR